jgi:nucleoside-diphosphate-sugar epimerase
MDFGTNEILITGANGWLGKSLIECLINGIENSLGIDKPCKNLKIKCLVLHGEDTSHIEKVSKNIKIVQGDITKIEDCRVFIKGSKGAILFHCAGIIHPKRTRQFFDINVGGTRNIIDASLEQKIEKIIFVSSNSPCGVNPTHEHLFEENYKYNPYMKYGQSKMDMENIINETYKKGNIKTVIIRPPWFYGPNQPQRQTKFYKMIRDGKVPIVGNGENKRSMACTINIAQGLIRAALNDKAIGETYWIADKTPYSFYDIIKTIREVMIEEFDIVCKNTEIKLPNLVSSFAYYLDSVIQGIGLYNKEIHVLSEMNKTIACSIQKAEKDLEYKPTVDLYNGTILSIKAVISEF